MTRLMKSSRVHFARSSSIRAQRSGAPAGADLVADACGLVMGGPFAVATGGLAATAGQAGPPGRCPAWCGTRRAAARAALCGCEALPEAAGALCAIAADSSRGGVSALAAPLLPPVSAPGLPASTDGSAPGGGSGAALWSAGGGGCPAGTLVDGLPDGGDSPGGAALSRMRQAATATSAIAMQAPIMNPIEPPRRDAVGVASAVPGALAASPAGRPPSAVGDGCSAPQWMQIREVCAISLPQAAQSIRSISDAICPWAPGRCAAMVDDRISGPPRHPTEASCTRGRMWRAASLRAIVAREARVASTLAPRRPISHTVPSLGADPARARAALSTATPCPSTSIESSA